MPGQQKKIWGLVIEDVNSGAVHLDVVSDYSTVAVLMSLRRFGSLRGWPSVIQSDPGSQLESAGGKLENWWSSFEKPLLTLAGSKNFEWRLSPVDSPWRQGKAERRIGVVKLMTQNCLKIFLVLHVTDLSTKSQQLSQQHHVWCFARSGTRHRETSVSVT